MNAFWKSWAARRFELWLLAAALVNLVALAVRRGAHPPAVLWGAAFDVAVTVPVLYFLLVVRGRIQPAVSLIPLCLLALLRATYVAPGMAWLRPWLGAAADIAVMAFLVARVRRGARAAGNHWDRLDRLRAAARELVPIPWAAEAVASEIALAWYALAWQSRPEVPPGAKPFSIHQRSCAGLFFAAMAGVSVAEAVAAHLVAMRWSPRAAWLLTALSAYGFLWLVAVARSFALRPAWVAGGELALHSGILYSLRTPVAQIAVARRAAGEAADLCLPPLTEANVRLEFREPVAVLKMYGLRRKVRTVALAVDDPEGFLRAVQPE